MSTLYDETAEIDAVCAKELGDPIKYTPAGYGRKDIDVHVMHADQMTDLGAGQQIDQDIELHIIKTDIPAKPQSADRIVLPRWPNKTFRPTNPSTDDSGTHWVVSLKEV